ncbi:MAG TPA: ANTAR domain-containing protein [Solirubrobacteraceae bacterium]|jgi:response regulator NasT
MTTNAERNLRILLADEDRGALQRLCQVLEGLGHEVTPFAVSVAEAIELIAREDPDVAFVVIHDDDSHALALIAETVEFASGPVIACGAQDPNLVARAAEMGIEGYVESETPEAVQAAIELALRRHRETARLEEKVDQLQSALDRRAVIERAKGILMERHGVDDRVAFELLRDHARSGGRRVVDVAQAVLDGHALLPRS